MALVNGPGKPKKSKTPISKMMGPVKDPDKIYESKGNLPEVTVKGRKYSLIDYLNDSGILDGVQTAANIAQLGSFIPHPVTQAVGKVGAGISAGISGIQAASDVSEGNYSDAAINAGSTILSSLIGRGTHKVNPKFLPKDSLFGMLDKGRRTPYLNVDKRVRKQTKGGLAANRAMLGGVASETIYNENQRKK
jgi:hypothetical protein